MNSYRPIYLQIMIAVVVLAFVGTLFSMQVGTKIEGGTYRRFTQYPYRGLMYDRHGKLLVTNEPQYDLMVIPHRVVSPDTTLLCELLGINEDSFIERLNNARRYSSTKESSFFDKLSNEEFARIQDQLVHFPGFYVVPRTTRSYPHNLLANVLGYTGEIDRNRLNADSGAYYQSGDYIGISGLESEYEHDLRGQRGVKYLRVNPQGVVVGSFNEGRNDTVSIPGKDLYTTLDLDLQRYAEFLMAGKVGSVVALEPSTGEILAMVSTPSYDPNQLTGRSFSQNFRTISQDTLKPLFTRPTQATYPPGSIFKILQSLVALQEGVIRPYEDIYCEGNLIGDHAPPGNYKLPRAIVLSSNNYFYKVFRRIIQQRTDPNSFIDARHGFSEWRRYVENFGLGDQLGIDIPSEVSGLIPTLDTYDDIYGENRWRFSNIYSLSIGQGEMLMTPLQMANLAAIMANKGFYYIPHLVKGIGESTRPRAEYLVKQETGIDSVHFLPVLEGMEGVVSGTARLAKIVDIPVIGKTGTAENPHGYDHSVFMAFAPLENPKIAIAVYVENAGWGGLAAGGTASLLIEKYIRGEISRPRKWIEDYILEMRYLNSL